MQEAISIPIINLSNNPLPAYATAGSSGMDIRAYLTSEESLMPLERKLIPTGIFVQIPMDYEIQIRPRSGMALKNGITCLNSPGTIDADYRGEIKVLLINLSNVQQVIQPGDRIAQMVVAKVEKTQWDEVTEIDNTQRGEGGFGHTGKI
jgi:dUTP pyrophosphatase